MHSGSLSIEGDEVRADDIGLETGGSTIGGRSRQERLEVTEGFVRRGYEKYSVVGGAARV